MYSYLFCFLKSNILQTIFKNCWLVKFNFAMFSVTKNVMIRIVWYHRFFFQIAAFLKIMQADHNLQMIMQFKNDFGNKCFKEIILQILLISLIRSY